MKGAGLTIVEKLYACVLLKKCTHCICFLYKIKYCLFFSELAIFLHEK